MSSSKSLAAEKGQEKIMMDEGRVVAFSPFKLMEAVQLDSRRSGNHSGHVTFGHVLLDWVSVVGAGSHSLRGCLSLSQTSAQMAANLALSIQKSVNFIVL